MQIKIDAVEAELREELKPTSRILRMLVKEIARADVRKDACHDELVLDAERVLESADNSTWDEARSEHTNNMAARLGRDPCRVAANLKRTKHGVQWCLERWRGLAASARAKGALSEPQRQFAMDLKGIDPLLRDHTEDVPAGNDLPAILALIDRETARLQARLDIEMEARDKTARANTKRGMPPDPDAATRRRKSNEARAHKRLVWAIDTFYGVRAGTITGPIIDPDTGKPLLTEDEARAEKPARPRPHVQESPVPPASGATTESDPVAHPADNVPIPVPQGLSQEEQEMFIIFGETLRRQLRESGLDDYRFPDAPPPQPPPRT
jgi:hypothetical protein